MSTFKINFVRLNYYKFVFGADDNNFIIFYIMFLLNTMAVLSSFYLR